MARRNFTKKAVEHARRMGVRMIKEDSLDPNPSLGTPMHCPLHAQEEHSGAGFELVEELESDTKPEKDRLMFLACMKCGFVILTIKPKGEGYEITFHAPNFTNLFSNKIPLKWIGIKQDVKSSPSAQRREELRRKAFYRYFPHSRI